MKESVVIEQTTTTEEVVTLAVEAANRIFNNHEPDGEDSYEPENGRSAQAAVLRLGELFDGLPKVIADALDGARSSGELLSSDRLQGLAELLQNADDANACKSSKDLGQTSWKVKRDFYVL